MNAAIDRVWRDERARVVAAVARRVRDLGLAEDVVQEAFLAAAARWPAEGIPKNPGAWLFAVAWRRALDAMRRVRTHERLAALPPEPPKLAPPEPLESEDLVDDDVLCLLLSCSHPALATDARIALTLRHVAGMTVRDIAAAFLVPEQTMAKRLVRARVKLRESGIPFALPPEDGMAERMDSVRAVVYLIFSEGYLSHDAGPPVRRGLCAEAIRLARHLHAMRPDDRETTGLLATCLLHDARADARVLADGSLVVFEKQDRRLWNHSAIAEARVLLADTVSVAPGPYCLMAAIAALHVADAGVAWPSIVALYDLLVRVDPSPLVAVNRAYAVGRASGPAAGLAALRAIVADQRIDRYAPFQAAFAELLERAGDFDGARDRWRRAAACSPAGAQRDALLQRIVEAGGVTPSPA